MFSTKSSDPPPLAINNDRSLRNSLAYSRRSDRGEAQRDVSRKKEREGGGPLSFFLLVFPVLLLRAALTPLSDRLGQARNSGTNN